MFVNSWASSFDTWLGAFHGLVPGDLSIRAVADAMQEEKEQRPLHLHSLAPSRHLPGFILSLAAVFERNSH